MLRPDIGDKRRLAMTTLTESADLPAGWLRNPSFDLGFILGIAALAVISGAIVVVEPRLFVPILLADIWLLGYHHVISTFTRLCFDLESFRTHRFLVKWLPLIVLAGVVLLGAGVGLWALASLYLYWQWFHYTRQSWGVSQCYRRKAGGLLDESAWVNRLAFYLLPFWGILHRSHQDPGSFLGLELRVLPVPALAVDIAAGLAILAIAYWGVTRLIAWWQGKLPLAHTLYLLSHYAVFYIGYILIENITFGWLVINIWHNAQYIAFVWHFNNSKFKSGIDPKAKFLSTISQGGKLWRYLLVCLAISTLVYVAIKSLIAAVVAPILIYQTINFHHYIVDGLIWKARKRPIQKTLGLSGS